MDKILSKTEPKTDRQNPYPQPYWLLRTMKDDLATLGKKPITPSFIEEKALTPAKLPAIKEIKPMPPSLPVPLAPSRPTFPPKPAILPTPPLAKPTPFPTLPEPTFPPTLPKPTPPLPSHAVPTKPQITPEIEKLEEKLFIKKSKIWLWLALGGLSVLIIAAGLAIYYLPLFEKPPIIIEEEAPVLPQPLISINSSAEIVLANATDLNNEFLKLQNLSVAEGEIKAILFSVQKGEKLLALNFNQFSNLLPISLPSTLQDKITKEFTLALTKGAVTNDLVLALKTTSAISEKDLRNWEKTIRGDISALMIFIPLEEEQTPEFQDNIYKGVTIRYKNFPDSDRTIDYAYLPDKELLLITTSKNSMFLAIDKINPQLE